MIAFSFYYPDNLDLLVELGEFVFGVPLQPGLPETSKDYISEVVSEVFAQHLAENCSS